ncbi:MAG: PD-(D/E)XK nuclease family protein [Acetobacter sp.]|nr:PD-(D/E)XK nuclease family protein [Bacteroides sp.]MCM1340573.1 PD-(D/E)XK nuclease family protein [Acetobacter sp.]MCM1433313.1 PD-(D/E)XK nuclease family protein [Clostridiales bacterium]
MLKIVLGRSGYGKTEYVFKHINQIVKEYDENVLLITPEQYSLVAERRLLTELGEEKISMVNNSSFTRIADEVSREYGYDQLKSLTKGSKAVLMMQAINHCKNKFKLFSKKIDTLTFVNSMIKIYDEMRSCNLNGDLIQSKSENINNVSLNNKLNDISLIMNSYDSLIENRYLDPADNLTRLYEKIKNKNYFKNKNVFIDGFNGFVAQEYKLLELIIAEAKEVIITLCSDGKNMDDTYSLFSYVNNSAKIIEKIALKADVEVKYHILDKNYRTADKALLNLEKNFFDKADFQAENNDSITIYRASSVSDECSNVSRQIRTLLRNGNRAKDIAVITSDLEKYRDELSYCFKKYEIPFFYDERQPIKTQPLVIFIEYLFRCVVYSLKSDDILSLAKTGLTNISIDDINDLENYVYLWNINGSKWKKPFENSTKGFVNEITGADKEQLKKINNTREKIIAPIIAFKKNIKGANALKISEEIYNTLICFNVDDKLREYASELSRINKTALAVQQGKIWDMVMSILDTMPKVLGEEAISIKDFSKLFTLVISSEDLGSLPEGMDNVQLGQADRIRTDNPKFTFILGANEGEFPKNVSLGGILTESDRKILLENDFKLYSYSELLNIQERYFAYMSCVSSTEKLFVSYTSNSKENAPSEIISTVKDSVSNVKEISINDLTDMDLIETKANAFDLMSERYLTNTAFYSSLKKYFENHERYGAVKALAENLDASIKNQDLAKELFDYDMYVSASRIEDYYNCPFRYFCKFGLSAVPRNKAEIDPMQRGTLIHYVLEMVLSKYGSNKLSLMSKSEIKTIIDDLISYYLSNNLGNADDIAIRFNYNFKRLSKLIYSVVYHLAEEFKTSDFEAKAFELDIDRDGSVKPEVIKLKDGGTIQIRGSIDRVDTFEKDGETFVRVVDYKSGNKTFSLADIMYGLNLQMFIYLFSLCEDNNAELTGIPAGVLYMHASRDIFPFNSKSEINSSIASEEDKSFKMKGIVIDEYDGEIAVAMEHELMGKYIPVEYKRNGDLKGNLASLAEFGLIHKKVNSLIAQMGYALHSGNIGRNPVKNKSHKKTCEYCDYADVCAGKRNIEFRITPDFTDSEVKEILAKEYADNEN